MTTYLPSLADTSFLLMTNNKFKASIPIEDRVIGNRANKNKIRILVVEDDPISQRVVQLALENFGYQADVASTGNEAIALFLSNSYGAILMDVGLPDTTGIEVTKKIRELERTRLTHTPIIALTAHAAAVAKEECLKAGMNEFSTKPLELECLNKILKSWAAKSS